MIEKKTNINDGLVAAAAINITSARADAQSTVPRYEVLKRSMRLLLSSILIALLIIPPIKAAELLQAKDVPGDIFEGAGPVWQVIAEHLYKDESGPGNIQKKQELSRLLFAEYLDYINSVGLDLARFEISNKARKDIKDQGTCSEQTLDATYRNIQTSLDANLELFTQAYCQSTCRALEALKFNAIANFVQPEDASQSCEGRARHIHANYHCTASLLPTLLGGANFPGSGAEPEPEMLGENIEFEFNKMSALAPSADSLNFKPTKSLALPIPISGYVRRPIEAPTSPGLSPLNSLPAMNKTEGSLNAKGTHFMTENDFNTFVNSKKKECKQFQVRTLASTFAEPGAVAERKSLPLPSSSTDPRWTDPVGPSDTGSEQPSHELARLKPKINGAKPNLAVTIPKNPACTFSGPDATEHFQKLREAYQTISLAQIDATLGHWPIYDEHGRVKTQALRLITGSADLLFYGLIDDLQANFNKACGAGGSSLDITRADRAGGMATIGGRHYTVTIKDGMDNPAKGPETEPHKPDPKSDVQPTPETVATYFQTNNSVVESILNGLLGADQIGSASPIEGRAGVIAQGVKNGAIDSREVGEQAAKGMTSAQAKEVIRLTEQYLGQGEYQAIKIFAAQLVGGAAGGMLFGGAAKGAGSLLSKGVGLADGTLGGGRISTLLMAVKESIMRPMMAGGERGAISIGGFSRKTVDSAKSVGHKTVDSESIMRPMMVGGERMPSSFGVFPQKIIDSAKSFGMKSGDEVKNLAQIAGEAKIDDIQTFLSSAIKSSDGAAIIFKSDKAVEHFSKHGDAMMTAFGKTSYNLKEYMLDAHHVMKTGQYAPEINGYVKLVGGQGSAKAAFVGLTQDGKYVTTMHIKTVSELKIKAPILGWE